MSQLMGCVAPLLILNELWLFFSSYYCGKFISMCSFLNVENGLQLKEAVDFPLMLMRSSKAGR
jgi:hypothetical protein